MICENCQSETAPNLPYCAVCGHEHNLSYDEVQELMTEELTGEREESTQSQIEQFLMATICILLCIWIWNGLYQNPKTCYLVPFYSEDVVIADHYPIPGSVNYIEVKAKNKKIRRPNPAEDE